MVVASHEPKCANDPFAAICGTSAALAKVVERLRLAAPLDIPVLLTGRSGVGKTLLASVMHLASRRRAGRFVEINCATLPEALMENELFGSAPGAHSSAQRTGTKGKVDAAERGTLFLDEITELSIGAQAKLLQLLHSKTYYRLGGTELRTADVRIVAATNVDLESAIAEKKFREDLYYRLRVLQARIPTLAERCDDLVPLSLGFVAQATERHQLPRKTLSPGAIRVIQSAEWPGNVRELANRIEAAAIHAHLRGSDCIECEDIFPEDPEIQEQASLTLSEATRRFQRRYIRGVLLSTSWNIVEAARVLAVSRSHVYNLIHALEITRG